MRTERLGPVLLALLTLGVLSDLCRGDTWAPWAERRVVEPRGRYYVVLKKTEKRGVVAWQFAERAKGSPPVEPAEENTRPRYDERNDPPVIVSVREGDAVLSEGRLAQAPLHVLVSSSGWGFVALERYGRIGYGSSVVLVPRTGEPVVELKLTDLFDAKAIAAFSRSTSSIRWYGGAWIDEEMRELVLVTEGGALRVVDLESAEVREGGEPEVRRGVRCEDPRGLREALELAVVMDLRGLEKDLLKLLSDEHVPLGVRLRGALLLARAGDPEATSLLVRIATEVSEEEGKEGAGESERRFALEHLPEILGDDAIPLLLKIVETEVDSGWGAAEALASYGERMLDDLERILAEGATHARYRAVSAVEGVASRRAMPLLLRAVREDPDLANSAVNAAIRLWGADIEDELVELLRAGTTQDGRIAGYFEKHRCPEAVSVLIAALSRQPKGSYERRRVVEALEFQTGESLGDDPKVWEDWLSSRGR